MQVDTLRFVDRFVGIPLCWICTLTRRLARLAPRDRPLPPPRKVLIVKLSEMGSTTLAYPALAELKRRCPEVELFFLTFKQNSAIVEVLALTPSSNIVTIDYSSTLRLVATGIQALAAGAPWVSLNPKWTPKNVRPYLGFDLWLSGDWLSEESTTYARITAGLLAATIGLCIIKVKSSIQF